MSSSSGWEKVGPAKKATDKAKGKNKAKKANGQNGGGQQMPNMEDVLGRDQLTALYAKMGMEASDIEKEKEMAAAATAQRKKEREEKKAGSGKAAASNGNGKTNGKANGGNEGKAGKQQQQQKPEKKRKPKNIQEAVANVSVADLKDVLEKVRAFYPDNQVLWLRDAASYLNLVLTSEEALTPSPDLDSTPLTLLTRETRKILTLLLEDCSESARKTGFETLVANLAHDMAKGLCPHGYLCLLQLMTEAYPALAVSNPERFGELMNSYQNRPNIGTAMLWSVGQGGRKDLGIGLKVWIECMLPFLPLRHYSRFVVSYLSALLRLHKARLGGASSAKMRFLYPAQFFQCFDAVFVTAPASLNQELQKELKREYPTLKDLSIGDCSSSHEIFPELLRRLTRCLEVPEKFSPLAKQELLTCLKFSLWNNMASIKHWQDMYISHLSASAEVLQHLDKNWSSAPKSVRRRNVLFIDTLRAFDEYNDGCAIQKDGLPEATTAVKSLLSKMSRGGNGGGWISYRTLSFILFWVAGFLLQKDIQQNHGFEKSKTGLFLKDVGMYDSVYFYGKHAFDVANNTGMYIRTKGPKYFNQTRDYIEPYARPVIHVASRVYEDVDAYAREKTPIVLNKLDEFLPGTKERIYCIPDRLVEFRQWLVKKFWYLIDRTKHYADKTTKACSKMYKTISTDVNKGKYPWYDVRGYAQSIKRSMA